MSIVSLDSLNLPPTIYAHLRGWHLAENTIGLSYSRVYACSPKIDTPPTMYLKVMAHEAWEKLDDEAQRLRWLSAYLPVPQVVAFAQGENADYLLMTAIEGRVAYEAELHQAKMATITRLAEGMWRWHRLPVEECPFAQDLATMISQAEERTQLGLVEEDDFDEERHGISAQELLVRLKDEKPIQETLKVTHGDYCLPNVLIGDDGRLAGFIDLGRMGISDVHRDIALCARSTWYNFGEDYAGYVLDAYGRQHIDQERIDYYLMLDEFF
jgi:aminoglycoside phosphotransferase